MTEHAHHDDRVAQYVAGTLPPDELELFEQHLIACRSCRAAVRLGGATRSALLENASPRRARLPVAWIGLAAAAVIVVVLTRSRSPEQTLGGIEPPPFVAGALRSAMDSTTALVDSGMTAYSSADYATAAEQLGRAARTDSSPAVQFFRGVSLLLRGDAEAALRALRAVSVESPYAPEAAYYAAKALVRLERADSAIALLDRTTGSDTMGLRLRAFADSLRRQ